jgi:FlaA1/EpsC-like NDP-sugar epimerase
VSATDHGQGFGVGKEFSMQQLAGKVALITGAGQGIGLAIARAFASAGACIAINAEGGMTMF